MNQLPKAIENYTKALECLEKLVGTEHIYAIYSLFKLSEISFHSKEYKKSIEFYLRLIEIFEKLKFKDIKKKSMCLSNLGYSYEKLDFIEQAKSYYEDALKLSEKLYSSLF